ncbi:amidase family protein, partial [Selenomonas sp.]
MRLYEKPAHVLHDMLVNKEITAVALTEDVLKRIDEVEGDVKAYLTITRDEALAQAKAVDEKIAKGETISFLEGIPGAIKDNICT